MKEITQLSAIDTEKGGKQFILPGYEPEMAALLNERKLRELSEVFTNPRGRVTAIKPGPLDMVAATLTARSSRAGERDITELFWKEFRQKTGEKVADRILNEFGDDSVREDASGYIFARDISVLTSMQIFLHPLITGIEASTRYINWGELPLQDFAVRPEKIMKNPSAREIYLDAINTAHGIYLNLWQPVWEYFVATNPKIEGQSEVAYKTAIKGAVCDALRGLLPLGIKTNLGIHGHYRALSESLMNLRASGFDETREFANEAAAELMKANPVFIKVVNDEHGIAWTEYQRNIAEVLKNLGKGKKSSIKWSDELNIQIEILNGNWLKDFLREALVAKNGDRVSASDTNLYTEVLNAGDLYGLLENVGGVRANRRHKIPDIFNAIIIREKIDNLSFGAWKDFNRHRNLLFKSEPDYSGKRGYVVPDEIRKIGGEVEEIYCNGQEFLHEAMEKLAENFPEERKLLLTHGTKTAVEMLMGGVEGFWIAELRSIPSGNPEYRKIAVESYKKLLEAAKVFRHLGSFVDEKEYPLGRIREAVKADLKGKIK